MFSDPNQIAINYYVGTDSSVPERNSPMNEDRRETSEMNLARVKFLMALVLFAKLILMQILIVL